MKRIPWVMQIRKLNSKFMHATTSFVYSIGIVMIVCKKFRTLPFKFVLRVLSLESRYLHNNDEFENLCAWCSNLARAVTTNHSLLILCMISLIPGPLPDFVLWS